jgi:hypothetical protein
MGLGLGIVLTMIGLALLWVAFHGTTAATPLGVFQELSEATGGGGGGAAG